VNSSVPGNNPVRGCFSIEKRATLSNNPIGVARLRLGSVSGLRRPFSRLCEERSDVAIQNIVPCALDCHVATLLAKNERGVVGASKWRRPLFRHW
jgi:hypothetical protein